MVRAMSVLGCPNTFKNAKRKDERNERIKNFIEKEFSVKSLDDMAGMFFKIARSINHPLKSIDLELTKPWGEQK